ncbi:MAG: glycosyltransferase [Rhodobacteraceae bacterium]|jgi:glycosyltransferase involved in cell wall biosynthesis|nr:glycosyltransferase [Paracoccaceae bacterium]
MYLIPITVPIFLDGDRPMLATDWKRALVLLRDSLGDRYGPLAVAAPFAPADESDQPLEAVGLAQDGIEPLPLFPRETRLRSYWRGTGQRVAELIADRLAGTQVLHGTVEDPLRPFCYNALMSASRAGIPTILVQDQDVTASMRDIGDRRTLRARLMTEVQARVHEAQTRRATRTADLCLFKGRGTIARYGGLARAVLPIEDTSYLSHEVVPEPEVRARLASLVGSARPLRFGFCGRLVHLKGLDRSLRILAAARAMGANVGLDIVGTGPEEDRLRALASELGMQEHVRFVGGMAYGPALIRRLGQCDALLFNPRMSETPRMLFDAYAAGLPLVADGIDYVLERRESEGAAVVLPWNRDEDAAGLVARLDAERQQLVPLTERALSARIYHAADTWYRRRAEATHEMVERHRRERTS